MAWYEQRSARLCLNQLNPIAAWLGEGGAAITSNHISGAAVLEYGPTEISAPLQPIWTSKCASLPTALPTQPRIPARLARFSTGNGWVCARHGLSAGAEWNSNVQFRAPDRQRFRGFIRVGTIYRRTGHPSNCRPRHTNRLSGGGPRSRRHRGTEGSNPFPSNGESANFRSGGGGRSMQGAPRRWGGRVRLARRKLAVRWHKPVKVSCPARPNVLAIITTNNIRCEGEAKTLRRIRKMSRPGR